jgi:hypothetical protein
MNKRNLLILMTSFAMAFGLAACGDDDSPGTPDADPMVADSSMDSSVDSSMAPPAVPSLGTQIDRTGRPAINTALNNTFNGDTAAKNAAKDAYNADGNVADWPRNYAADIADSLAILDGADTNCGNQLLASAVADGEDIPANRYSALAGILADDRLYMHTDLGSCGYLGLEVSVVTETDPAGCGGRLLGNDVIASSYSVLVAGDVTGSIDDGITEDSATHSDTAFPFVAAPN